MRVVILGGGFCGSRIANQLDKIKDINVTLIDKNPFFEYNPSAIKCLTNPGYQQNIQVPFNKFLSNTTIITDSIQKILPSEVKTNHHRIEFDYAVLCLGCSYPILLSNTENVYTLTRSYEAKELFSSLKNAKKIIIVGGGYIGTEIASELAIKRKDIHITMVHSQDRILKRNSRYVSKYITNFLQKRGVNFLFNEKIIYHPSSHEFITKSGKKLIADLCIWCTGINVDTSYLEGFIPGSVDEKNRIKVNDSLQLLEYPHIFAGGDIISINEEKTARKAELHADIIASNLVKLKKGKQLVSYKKGTSPMVISLGDNRGVGIYGRLILPGFISGIGKWFIEWWTLRQFY
jgi:NADH dehydrogenase FAD-containing subunit